MNLALKNSAFQNTPMNNLIPSKSEPMISSCTDEDDIYEIEYMIEPEILLKNIRKKHFGCIYKQLRKLCADISAVFEDALEQNCLDTTEVLSDIDAFLTFCAAARISPAPLFCKKHQGVLYTEVNWSSSLVSKLTNYLLSKIGNETEIDKLLIRFFEIIINPPQDFGTSEVGQEFARQIKIDQTLENSQICSLVSSIFMFLPAPARKRVCGDLQDNLIQLLEPEIITKDMLILLYFVSLNGKFQGDLFDKLFNYIIDSFQFEHGVEDINNDNRAIAIQILVNISQSLSEFSMKEFINKLYTYAMTCYQRHKRTDILTQVISPLLNSIPFSNFVPICLYLEQDLSDDNIPEIVAQNSDILGTQLDLLTATQQQNLLDHIQIYSQGVGPFESFSFKWRKWDIIKGSSPYKDLKGTDSILIVFSFFLENCLIRLIVYISSRLTSGSTLQEDPEAILESSEKNLLFFCIDDQPLQLLDIQPTILFSSSTHDPAKIELRDKNKISLLEFSSTSIIINHQHIGILDPQYIVAQFTTQAQQIIFNPFSSLFIWTGASSLNLNRLQEPYGIYGSSPQASSFREAFETLRPNQKVFFAPKNMTIGEFLKVLCQDEKDIVKTFQIHYKQKVVTLDTKVGDLNENQDNCGLFEIKDLLINGLKDGSGLKDRLASPYTAYQTIIQKYSRTINRPLLEYFSKYGGALGFLNKFSAGEKLERDPIGLLKLYEKINKAIGPYINTLTSIFGADLLLMLWHVLSKGSSSDMQAVLQLIYKSLLRNMVHGNLLASDPEQLYNLIIETMESLFLNDFRFHQHFPEFRSDLNSAIETVREAGLIQDSEIIGLFNDAVGIRFHSFNGLIHLIGERLLKNSLFMSRVTEQFTSGSQLLSAYCPDRQFYRKFVDLAEAIANLEKISSYVLALSKNEDFENILASIVSYFQKQIREDPSHIKIDQKMEENMLTLIKYTYTALDQVIQSKNDVSSETSLMDMTKNTLDVFRFLFEELNAINARKERAPVIMTTVKDITQSVTQILKKPAESQKMCAQGFDAASHFCQGYLTEMKKLSLVQTLTNTFEALMNFKDEMFSLQVQEYILGLLEVWSSHHILKELFQQEVRNSRSSQAIPFGAFCMENLKKIRSDLLRPSHMHDEAEKSNGFMKGMKTKVMRLLKDICCNLDLE